MESIHIYNIDDVVSKRDNISEEQKRNIGEIFIKLLGENESGIPGEVRRFVVDSEENTNHKLLKIKNDFFNKDSTDDLVELLDSFAEDLLKAELVKDGGEMRRHKRITQGMLFIKMLSSKIIFLKLEEIPSIDKETFEITDSFGIDRKYYKAAIYCGDEVNVVDKNKAVANYWVDKFLNINPLRDDASNTKDLVSVIKDKRLFNREIMESDLGVDIYKSAQDYIFTESRFDSDDMYNLIMNKIECDELSKEDIFVLSELSKIDSDFLIDKKIVGDSYKKRMKVNDNITIDSKNIYTAIKAQHLVKDDTYLKVRIDNDYEGEIEEIFKEYS
ncbi:hypothetical protein [Wansuia hejianensis]|uniref:Nucleoid-associated protein n=1 Tax=Wansuia hejianensis TaxID=2763667 RepID=A0A926EVH4_9FIRM|nr:hypothetical protein [Wansuia hejianensis]MBC8589676.1 hypothetical protein [Wansuia hejianensis]